ncbi:MAG: glutathione S-transferase [Gammaproteobacteria bacterium]|nr:glutathione S-transferase [Gammaproteobacteria bacterium]
MPYVHLVIGLALVEFLYFALAVAGARGRYKVAAPAVSGNEIFERYLRVQMNTLEQLIVFIPSIVLFGQYLSPYVAAALGAVFLIGRIVYFVSYIKDPKKRELGFILSFAPTVALLGGALFGAARAALYY